MNDQAETGFRITKRDRKILEWIGRVRIATIGQVIRRFDLPRTVAYGRVQKMERAGLLESASYGGVLGRKVVATTAAGMRAAGVALPVSSGGPALRSALHVVELTDLTIDYELALADDPQAVVLTEREIAADAAARQAKGWRLRVDEGGEPRWHLPDLVIVRTTEEGQSVGTAVELETSVKPARRLRMIIKGYAAAPEYRQVTYVCGDDRVFAAIDSARTSLDATLRDTVVIARWVRMEERSEGVSLFDQ